MAWQFCVLLVAGIALYAMFRLRTDASREHDPLRPGQVIQDADLSPDTVIVHGDGKVLYLNAAGVRLFGASSANEIVGTPVLELVHPDYHQVARTQIQQEPEDKHAAMLLEV